MDNIKKLKGLRNSSECLFNGDPKIKCNSQGKFNNEKNHIISKSSYLERIADNKQVMVFAWEEPDYYKNNGELQKRNIKNANTYRVFCGEHDKMLFNEIENNKQFDENNSKQLFQFALRAFSFEYAHNSYKRYFDNLVPEHFNRVAEAHFICDTRHMSEFKHLYETENWCGVEHTLIKLRMKIDFISCFSLRPIWDINRMYILSTHKVAVNVFPEKDCTIILLSRLAKKSCAIEKYCNNLFKTAIKNEAKFIEYMNKFIISSDMNIAIRPKLWESFSKTEREHFYECALFLRKNNSNILNLFFKALKYNFYSCKINLFNVSLK